MICSACGENRAHKFFTCFHVQGPWLDCSNGGTRRCFIVTSYIPKSWLQGSLGFLRLACCVASKALRFGYGYAVDVGVDVGAGDVEVDVIYIIFIMSAHNIGYLVP